MAELFGNSRSQQLAGGKPSDVLALCWMLASAARDRSLKSSSERGRVTMSWLRFLARARAAPRPAVSIWRRRRQLWGLFGASRSKPLAEGWLWRVCALAFQAGEIVLLIRGRAGAKAARGEFLIALDAGAGRRRGRRRFPVWHARSAVAELFGNSRSQQLAGGKPSDGLALCWILASAARDRSLNLHLKGAAFHVLASFPRAREGGRSASGFDLAAPAPAMGTLRREPIETAGRGVAVACVRSGISGWRDRAPDPWACGRQGGARRIKINKATAKQSPRLSLTKSLNPKERLSVGNWIVQRLYDDAVKETVEL